MTRSHIILGLFLSTSLFACTGDDGGGGGDDGADGGTEDGGDGGTEDGGDGGTDGADGGDTGETGDPGTPMPDTFGTLTGTVDVQLYENGSSGPQPVAWEDSPFWSADTGVTFPYGKIFVGAYFDNPVTGRDIYGGQTVIGSPTVSNPYSMDIAMIGAQTLTVYASLDATPDNIVGSWDPVGVYGAQIPLEDGDIVNDVNITIMVNLDLFPGGSGGPGTGGPTIHITGNVEVSVADAGGNAKILISDLAGNGPYYSTDSALNVTTAPDSLGTYDLEVPADMGSVQLLGVVDSNHNTMYDPADIWGAYVISPDVNGNPISIGSSDRVDHTVQIPLGGSDDPYSTEEAPGLSLIPFVTISGTLGVNDANFDAFPSGTTAYVTALKYRPNYEFEPVISSTVYDYQDWAWAELTGQTTVPWSLIVPANSTIYLWGFADTDIDGLVNESMEPVASQSSTGQIAVGTESISGVTLELNTVGI